MLYPIIRRQRRPLLPPEETQVAPVVSAQVVEQPETLNETAPDVPAVTAAPSEEPKAFDRAIVEQQPPAVIAEVITPDLTLVPEEQPATKGKRAKVSQTRKAEAE